MMNPLVGLLVLVLVLCVVYWAIHKLAAAFGLATQIVTVLDVLLVIIAIWYLLGLIGYAPRIS